MLKSVEKTAKTMEEALASALEELGVSEDRVTVEILEEPSKGLFGFIGGKPARILVNVRPLDALTVGKQFLSDLFQSMHIAVELEVAVPEEEGPVAVNLRGEDLGILIGKHGQTLDALQYLTNLAANRDAEEKIKFVIDVEEYRRRRAETLTRLAQRLASKVKRMGEPVVLEPMTPHERKIIHMALQDDRRISTYSEGEEPNRKVVIALKR
ncbi:RNA-binding cell elongation regulator Jag/EloR [Anaeromusa sp.]|jgi:spoIIIJ-associated protein|uniref:RNA-binding cell elongation regulator Jag/EloR n=1 Tax=Anaeromusa sp. TaxID=1872520 RepID=UPI0026105C76|nr:RNA-binding cell elongation regulator Jag/EloR [Anaeromusa sp.]MDD3157422.1 protein jag [Anaeromusa sp.]MEA4835899.1 RNA-binding cell elongation regulator Jag/EloR [Anaeromusa sp.]